MRGLDRAERRLLVLIERRVFQAEVEEEDALQRCYARNLIQASMQLCENCGEVHDLPVLTVEGKTALWCDEMVRTLEF